LLFSRFLSPRRSRFTRYPLPRARFIRGLFNSSSGGSSGAATNVGPFKTLARSFAFLSVDPLDKFEITAHRVPSYNAIPPVPILSSATPVDPSGVRRLRAGDRSMAAPGAGTGGRNPLNITLCRAAVRKRLYTAVHAAYPPSEQGRGEKRKRPPRSGGWTCR